MELTWLADTPQSRRRTRALRACPSCQKRKKRCRHLGHENSTPSQSLGISSPNIPRIAARTGASSHLQESSRRANAHTASSLGISRIERFVGDLNPEAAIREKVDAPDGTHHRDRVGLWINAPINQGHDGNGEVSDTSSIRTENISKQDSDTGSILHQRYISALKACDRLPRSTIDPLAAIYFSRVNHILPLVDSELFNPDSPDARPSVFLERAICLVAAKDKAACPHLRLTPDGPLVTTRKFCSDLYNGLVCAMDAALEPDRVTRIRILALMSLHSEGYEGTEAASMHICRAIHQAQTAGLHLERPNRHPGDSLTNLFWCLWTLDKVHASIGGRPVLLADRDIGIKRPDLTSGGSRSAFNVWFALSELLATVISFYRPSADDTTGWETDYPSFEEIMGYPVRGDLDYETLGVIYELGLLELFYHAIGILSCRYRPSHRPDGSRPSYTRQGLAAVRIYSLVATECAQRLPPLPIVPYAVALSMGVSYQQYRNSKLITHIDRAKSSIEACCALLEELSTSWYSAEAMARLGRKALHQIEGRAFEDGQPGHGPPLSIVANNSQGNSASSAAPTQGILLSKPSVDSNEPHRSSERELPLPLMSERPAPMAPDEQHGDLQDSVAGDGFADIDMLFDDFLDLSLPTNFWDPVFFSTENDQDL
ncbi:hypothetical protein BJX63DRAFT_423974 [Aspergillus granulosus]|uniref:Xylanolytic transcriptional activator regulatory domain-containing protein n=1 Tax=Aspergillus granulosus TaxID=176169 RepID=A0ABR4H1J4_9EURO